MRPSVRFQGPGEERWDLSGDATLPSSPPPPSPRVAGVIDTAARGVSCAGVTDAERIRTHCQINTTCKGPRQTSRPPAFESSSRLYLVQTIMVSQIYSTVGVEVEEDLPRSEPIRRWKLHFTRACLMGFAAFSYVSLVWVHLRVRTSQSKPDIPSEKNCLFAIKQGLVRNATSMPVFDVLSFTLQVMKSFQSKSW